MSASLLDFNLRLAAVVTTSLEHIRIDIFLAAIDSRAGVRSLPALTAVCSPRHPL